MAILADHYPHLEPSDSSPNQLATRVTLPFWEGRSLSSGEGLGTSLDEAWRDDILACHAIVADGYRQLWLSHYAYRQYRVAGV
jgi:hypothetical protein